MASTSNFVTQVKETSLRLFPPSDESPYAKWTVKLELPQYPPENTKEVKDAKDTKDSKNSQNSNNSKLDPKDPRMHTYVYMEDSQGNKSNKLDLDDYLGNVRGRFVWSRKCFSASAIRGSIKLSDNRILEANLKLTATSWEEIARPRALTRQVDLAKHIGIDDAGNLVPFDIREPRSILLCFDGTGTEFDDTNTNVVKLFSCLKKNNPDEQMVYYQTGIGTYSPQGAYQPITTAGKSVSKLADQGVAWYLDQHVMSGYRFLMQTYRIGDRVCIFGFSRGAYTARAFAGMLHAIGLLPLYNEEHIQKAYELFSSKKPDPTQCERFKRTFSYDVPIDFLGVWDTVSSVGLTSQTLPNVTTNPSVATFRHAISLDETRAKFQCLHWTDGLKGDDRPGVDVEEVYFAGGHCDVGGGNDTDVEYDPDVSKLKPDGTPFSDAERAQFEKSDYHKPTPGYQGSLANISLRWMLHELMKNVPEVQLDWRALKRWDIPFKRDGMRRIKIDTSSDEAIQQEMKDALAKINPANRSKWIWLEYLPFMSSYQDEQTGKIKTWKGPHRDHGRLPVKCYVHSSYCVHRSALYRVAYMPPEKIENGWFGGRLTTNIQTKYYTPHAKVLSDSVISTLRALNRHEITESWVERKSSIEKALKVLSKEGGEGEERQQRTGYTVPANIDEGKMLPGSFHGVPGTTWWDNLNAMVGKLDPKTQKAAQQFEDQARKP